MGYSRWLPLPHPYLLKRRKKFIIIFFSNFYLISILKKHHFDFLGSDVCPGVFPLWPGDVRLPPCCCLSRFRRSSPWSTMLLLFQEIFSQARVLRWTNHRKLLSQDGTTSLGCVFNFFVSQKLKIRGQIHNALSSL
jgi:hypothetical protein